MELFIIHFVICAVLFAVVTAIGWVISRRPLLSASIGLCIAGGALFWFQYKHLFPRQPDCVPNFPKFQLVTLECRDQMPLWPSYQVYALEYRFAGTVQAAENHIRRQVLAHGQLGNPQVAHSDTDYRDLRVVVPTQSSPDLPWGGELQIQVTRVKVRNFVIIHVNLLRNRDL